VPQLAEWGAQVVLLGSGERRLENGFRDLTRIFPGRVGVNIGYDEAQSHRIQGGADVIMLPSRSEPCGLIQMYGLRYGTLPLVRRVGGLADTVVHADDHAIEVGSATGFVFDHADAGGLLWACGRAIQLYHQPDRWHRVQRHAMAQDFSWDQSARRYDAMYRSVFADV
jgi:starch synthase